MNTLIRSHYQTAIALLIFFLASMCARAQLQPLPSTRTTPAFARVESKTGEIRGSVVSESGEPLVNATVWVRPATLDGLPVTNTTTNREGGFDVGGLQPGSYDVGASMPGYIPKSPESGPAVQRNADAVTLVFVKGGVITGTVTNSKGDPVVAIGINVEMVVDESGRPSAAIIHPGVTDDRGIYRVYGLQSGSYIVSADSSNNYSPAGVNEFASNMPTYAPSSGREAAEEIAVRVGQETTNVDIRYRGERGSTISGIVKGKGTGERGFSVALTSLAEKGPRRETSFRDPNGEFAFEGLPDGDYHLVANAYWNERERGESESMVLTVRGADIAGIELTAAALSSVSGKVVLKELKDPVPDCNDKSQPTFSETSVAAWHRVIQGAKQKPGFVWRRASETPDSQGNLTLRNLPASDYYFGVRVQSQQWYLQSIVFVPTAPGAKPTDAARSWTTIKPGDRLSGLTVTVARGGALVRGKIALAEGQTLSEKLTVYLVPAEASQAEEALRYFAAPVNSDGNFWLHNVMPGRYWMLAQPGSEDTRSEVSKIRLPDAAASRSQLRHAAAQRKTEIELKPCQDLTFRLPL